MLEITKILWYTIPVRFFVFYTYSSIFIYILVTLEWRIFFMIKMIHGIMLIVYIIVSVALAVIVLMQEGKQAGLTGAISGAAETYWGKNKSRSMEGGLVLATRVLAVVFILLSLLLNLSIFS